MKPKQVLLFTFSSLIVGLLPIKAYADDSKQVIDGNNNICSTQMGNSDGNNVTCHVNVYITEGFQTAVQSNSSNTFGNQIPTQSKNQFILKNCENPNISNEDKYILECPGY
jgi:hypothetical protein